MLIASGVLTLAGVITVGLAAQDAVLASQDLSAARDGLRVAQNSEPGLDTVRQAVAEAQGYVAMAEDRLSSPAARLVAAVPLVGRSLDAEREVARASASTLRGVRALAEAAPDLRVGAGVDVDRLARLSAELDPVAHAATTDLASLRATPTGWTPPMVSSAVDEAAGALAPIVEQLHQAAAGSAVAASLLGVDGPRPLLVALGNNAELRGTGGYVSTFASGQLVDGTVQLDPFQDVLDVNDPVGQTRVVPAPQEFAQDYGPFLADTTLWREWTMSPDVPDAASVGAAASALLLDQEPEVVVLLDVPALSALVALGGRDVELPDGSRVGAEELTRALLVDSYARAGEDSDDQDQRRAELRAAAGETLTQLLGSQASPLTVVRELGRLARGRHLAVWSTDPVEQQTLEALGLAGSADPAGDDLLLVSVNNLGANKLDYYVDRTVDVEVVVGRDRAEVVQTVRLANRAPDDLVPYVAGNDRPGTLVERVEFSLSPQATFESLRKDGEQTTGAVRTGSERARAHTFVTLPRGTAVDLELRYSIPVDDGYYRLRLIPQALAKDASLSVSIRATDGEKLEIIEGPAPTDGRLVVQGAWAEQEVLVVVLDGKQPARP